MQSMFKSVVNFDNQDDDNLKCDLCLDPNSYDGNELVVCELCLSAVHQSCYGLELKAGVPDEDWLCWRCRHLREKFRAYQTGKQKEMPIQETSCCFLCNDQKGIMVLLEKEPLMGQWIHIVCVNWSSSCSFVIDKKTNQLVYNLDRVPIQKHLLDLKDNNEQNDEDHESHEVVVNHPCYICQDSKGQCIKCDYGNCENWFHVRCAISKQLIKQRCEMNGHYSQRIKVKKRRNRKINIDVDENSESNANLGGDQDLKGHVEGGQDEIQQKERDIDSQEQVQPQIEISVQEPTSNLSARSGKSKQGKESRKPIEDSQNQENSEMSNKSNRPKRQCKEVKKTIDEEENESESQSEQVQQDQSKILAQQAKKRKSLKRNCKKKPSNNDGLKAEEEESTTENKCPTELIKFIDDEDDSEVQDKDTSEAQKTTKPKKKRESKAQNKKNQSKGQPKKGKNGKSSDSKVDGLISEKFQIDKKKVIKKAIQKSNERDMLLKGYQPLTTLPKTKPFQNQVTTQKPLTPVQPLRQISGLKMHLFVEQLLQEQLLKQQLQLESKNQQGTDGNSTSDESMSTPQRQFRAERIKLVQVCNELAKLIRLPKVIVKVEEVIVRVKEYLQNKGCLRVYEDESRFFIDLSKEEELRGLLGKDILAGELQDEGDLEIQIWKHIEKLGPIIFYSSFFTYKDG